MKTRLRPIRLCRIWGNICGTVFIIYSKEFLYFVIYSSDYFLVFHSSTLPFPLSLTSLLFLYQYKISDNWNRLPAKVIDGSPIYQFKSRLNKVLWSWFKRLNACVRLSYIQPPISTHFGESSFPGIHVRCGWEGWEGLYYFANGFSIFNNASHIYLIW